MSTVNVKTVEFEPRSARFTPVKYLFTRKGLVRVSIGKPEDGLMETRVENTIEVALPFVDDFSQNCESGEATELKVSQLFHLYPCLSRTLSQFTCRPENLGKLTSALTSQPKLVHDLLGSELIYTPTETVTADEQMEDKVANLVGTLEEHEDTLRVYTTLDSGPD